MRTSIFAKSRKFVPIKYHLLHFREYRKKGKEGLREGVDPNNLDKSFSTHRILLKIIEENYASYIPQEGWTGYKYPDQQVSDGEDDGMKGGCVCWCVCDYSGNLHFPFLLYCPSQ